MKKLSFLLIPVLFSMCQSPKAELEEARMQNDSLQRLVITKDSAMIAVVDVFNEIESNLQDIKQKENIISLNANDAGIINREDQINKDIQYIYDIMLENKNKVAKLERQLKHAGIENQGLQKIIANLEIKIKEKDAEIFQLQQKLKNMNIEVDELTYKIDTLAFDNQVKQAIIDAQDESLHTAYYIIGSSKELKDNGVLDKKGVLAKNKKINNDFERSLFTKIDIREKTSFDINASKVKILSTHPGYAYSIEGEKPVESIDIIDPDDFWSVTKYLVVVVY